MRAIALRPELQRFRNSFGCKLRQAIAHQEMRPIALHFQGRADSTGGIDQVEDCLGLEVVVLIIRNNLGRSTRGRSARQPDLRIDHLKNRLTGPFT